MAIDIQIIRKTKNENIKNIFINNYGMIVTIFCLLRFMVILLNKLENQKLF